MGQQAPAWRRQVLGEAALRDASSGQSNLSGWVSGTPRRRRRPIRHRRRPSRGRGRCGPFSWTVPRRGPASPLGRRSGPWSGRRGRRCRSRAARALVAGRPRRRAACAAASAAVAPSAAAPCAPAPSRRSAARRAGRSRASPRTGPRPGRPPPARAPRCPGPRPSPFRRRSPPRSPPRSRGSRAGGLRPRRRGACRPGRATDPWPPPRTQHTAEFEAQVVVQPAGRVLLDDEAEGPARAGRAGAVRRPLAARLGGLREVALLR